MLVGVSVFAALKKSSGKRLLSIYLNIACQGQLNC